MQKLNKNKLRLHTKKKMALLCKKAGSQTKLANDLGVHTSTISRLVKGDIMPGPHLCVLIESKYGLKKEELRPDFFLLNER